MSRKKKKGAGLKSPEKPAGEAGASTSASGSTNPKRARSRSATVDQRESDADSLSNRRKSKKRKVSTEQTPDRKGKGKAKAKDELEEARLDVLRAMRVDMDAKNAIIATQAGLLASFKNSVTCNVCLETLDRPYTLACGHVFCRKCLIGWFHRPDPEANLQVEQDSSSESDDETFSSPDSVPDVPLPADSSPDASTSSSDDSSSDSSSSSSDSSESSSSGDERGARPVMRGELLGRPFEVTGRTDDATWNAMERQFFNAIPAVAEASNAARRAPAIANGTGDVDVAQLRAARLARLGLPPDGDAAGSTDNRAEPAAGGAESLSSTARAASEGAAAAEPARAAEAVPEREQAAQEEAEAPIPHVIPRGEHRLKNLICPQCRVAVSEHAPFRVFVLTEMVLLVRNAEANGLLPRSGSMEPSGNGASTSAATLSHVDALPGLDDTDPTWGGLFTNEGRESARDQARRYARVVEDREDGVRRCSDCNWEVDEDTGCCNGCGRLWNLDRNGDDTDDDSGDEVGFVLPWGANGERVLDDDEEEEEDDEDEESHNSFIVGSDEEIEEASGDDIVFPDEVERGGEESDSSRRRSRKDKKANRKVRTIAVESDDPDASSSSSSDQEEEQGSADRGGRRLVVVSSSDEDDE